MVPRAHASTPCFPMISVQASTPGLWSRRGGGVPAIVSVRTRSGNRAAKRRAMVAAIFAPTK